LLRQLRSINDVKRLVAQLKNTIQNENIAQTTALLQQLEQKAGKNSIVTLRMNGYWALQQNMNQDSRQFYQQLLMQQPDDLEANMNIALLDVRLGDNDKAKNRLNKMMVLYPESSSVKQFTKSLASMGLR
jgi:thioredoxin-like negative regulator of GroEL